MSKTVRVVGAPATWKRSPAQTPAELELGSCADA
jgi:hypothetical protein